MPRRTVWLVAGVAIGAGSSLWMEHKVRRTLNEAAARLQPDALLAEAGRSARDAATGAGDRVRDAFSTGRSEMQRREEQLWEELARRGTAPPSTAPPGAPAALESPDRVYEPEGRRRSRRHRGLSPTWAKRDSTSNAAT
jgi:hypothetical protein